MMQYPTAAERDKATKISKRRYETGSRYNYSAVDAYATEDGREHMTHTVIAGMTRKEAAIIAGACGEAYQHGITDAIRAMRPSLSKES